MVQQYIQEIYLDINPNNSYIVITAKQFDADSRGIRVHVTENGQPYNITGDYFQLRVKKPDGHVVVKNATLNNDQTITAIFNDQCLLVSGRAYADIVELSDGKILSTAPFIIDIKPSPNPDKTQIESTDEYAAFNDFINDGLNIINTAQNWSEQANMWANGQTTGTPNSNNNAKHWAEEAENRRNEIWATEASVTMLNDIDAPARVYPTLINATNTVPSHMEFQFEIPKSNPVFCAFDIELDTGYLVMICPDYDTYMKKLTFEVDEETGQLEVSFNE